MIVNKQAKHEAKQLFHLCQVNGLMNEERIRQVVQRIAESGHRNSLAVLAHFLRLVRIDQAQHTAKIQSAAPLPDELRTTTEASLRRMYGTGLNTIFSERPSLIGGMRIQVGSDVYDGSVQAGLAALEKSF